MARISTPDDSEDAVARRLRAALAEGRSSPESDTTVGEILAAARLRSALEEGLASGLSDRTIEDIIRDRRKRDGRD